MTESLRPDVATQRQMLENGIAELKRQAYAHEINAWALGAAPGIQPGADVKKIRDQATATYTAAAALQKRLDSLVEKPSEGVADGAP